MQNSANQFLGLAHFLRANINGDDLTATGAALLAKANEFPNDANAWMNLSTAMLCLGQRELGLAMQSQALDIRRVYSLPSTEQPSRIRLLMLMIPGDLSANIPLDCLLEHSDIELYLYYLSPGGALEAPVPEHDVLMVAFSELVEDNELLKTLDQQLTDWPCPVINPPLLISRTRRDVASRLLQNVENLSIPPTLRVERSTLRAVSERDAPISELISSIDFPVILRPVDSHAGRNLVKAENTSDITEYLSGLDDTEFYLSKFVDYSGKDGLFRKFRIAIVDGTPYACHMAVSSHWMVHYVNAGMYEDAAKRAEERLFMENFDAFASRHSHALEQIYRRTGLDYLCIDCAETRTGELLIFEIDHAMVVHAMDSDELFPHKQFHIQKVKNGFRDFLLKLTSAKNNIRGNTMAVNSHNEPTK